MDQGAVTGGVKVGRASQVPFAANARGALRKPHLPTAQDKAIAVSDSVRSVFNLPVFAGFIIALPLSAAGWVAKKMGKERGSALLGGVGEAISQGPRMTSNANALHLPADMAQMVAARAESIGGKAAPVAESFSKRSVALHGWADKTGASLSKAFAPIRASVGGALEKVNLREPMKKALSFGGKLPVGAGIMAIASTAGIASILMKRNKAAKEHMETLNDMRAVFGANSPLVAEASKRYSKEQSHRIISSGLECASEASFVVFESVTNAGMGTFAGLMAGQMGLSSAQQMFEVENPAADAFEGLSAVQRGMQVPAGQQAFWFQTLLGALPAAQAKGGSRNLLAAAAGKELASKGTTLAQFAEIVGDETKLNALLSEAHDKMEAAKAAKTAAPAKDAAHPTMHQAAPAAKVSGSVHQGHVVANDNAISRNENDAMNHAERVRHQQTARPAEHGKIS